MYLGRPALSSGAECSFMSHVRAGAILNASCINPEELINTNRQTPIYIQYAIVYPRKLLSSPLPHARYCFRIETPALIPGIGAKISFLWDAESSSICYKVGRCAMSAQTSCVNARPPTFLITLCAPPMYLSTWDGSEEPDCDGTKSGARIQSGGNDIVILMVVSVHLCRR